jgi:hypothetical protein
MNKGVDGLGVGPVAATTSKTAKMTGRDHFTFCYISRALRGSGYPKIPKKRLAIFIGF